MGAAELNEVWAAGLAAVEPLLAEGVVFEWPSGDMPPCRGRGAVAEVLRGQVDPGSGRLPALRFEDVAEDLVLGTSSGAEPEIAVAVH